MAHFLPECTRTGRVAAKIFRFTLIFALMAIAGDTPSPRASAQENGASLYSLYQGANEARGAAAKPAKAPAQEQVEKAGRPDTVAPAAVAPRHPPVVAVGVERKDEKIKLTGMVSTQEDEKIVLGMIAAAFPGASIHNKLKVNKAAIGGEIWLSGVSFTLRQLAMLKTGRAQVQDNIVNLTGEAAVGSGYEAVHRALKEELPPGLVTGQVSVKPPSTTYVWLAQLQAGNVSISGRVPDRTAHQALTQLVAGLFPKAHFDDKMEVAEGAPESWFKAAWLSVYALQFLQSGSVSITEKTIRIEGVPSDENSLQKIGELTASLPAGFRMENNVIENQSIESAQVVKP
jgi:hypothetical protein